ncbi:sulfurtransferase [Shivajiella indica]|uniref:Sulfurtransferase n=1 Tax=Shivajiella indica TaxID=872115 RepID=A0ABW5BD55_9BACT
MKTSLSPIIKVIDLSELKQNEEFVLIDACFGKENYEASHLEGALHVDLNTELSDIKEDFAHGGRHPLPKPSDFCKLLGNLGISPSSHVVVYDDKNGSNAAARFWWMLKAIGHEKIQVLDGGKDAAVKSGFPLKSGKGIPSKKSIYPQSDWSLPLATIEELDQVSLDENFIVIDVREHERYIGKKEPIDLIAGHIPGAINVPFANNLDEQGNFLPSEILKQNYSKIFGSKKASNIIVHCGSGVTACHSLLAIAYAGFDIPKLYVGSWSEWSRNNRTIITE